MTEHQVVEQISPLENDCSFLYPWYETCSARTELYHCNIHGLATTETLIEILRRNKIFCFQCQSFWFGNLLLWKIIDDNFDDKFHKTNYSEGIP